MARPYAPLPAGHSPPRLAPCRASPSSVWAGWVEGWPAACWPPATPWSCTTAPASGRPTCWPPGARWADSPAEATAGAEAVLVMVSDDAASRSVWLGADGVLAGDPAPDAFAIECSTLSHDWVLELSAAVAAKQPALPRLPGDRSAGRGRGRTADAARRGRAGRRRGGRAAAAAAVRRPGALRAGGCGNGVQAGHQPDGCGADRGGRGGDGDGRTGRAGPGPGGGDHRRGSGGEPPGGAQHPADGGRRPRGRRRVLRQPAPEGRGLRCPAGRDARCRCAVRPGGAGTGWTRWSPPAWATRTRAASSRSPAEPR